MNTVVAGALGAAGIGLIGLNVTGMGGALHERELFAGGSSEVSEQAHSAAIVPIVARVVGMAAGATLLGCAGLRLHHSPSSSTVSKVLGIGAGVVGAGAGFTVLVYGDGANSHNEARQQYSQLERDFTLRLDADGDGVFDMRDGADDNPDGSSEYRGAYERLKARTGKESMTKYDVVHAFDKELARGGEAASHAIFDEVTADSTFTPTAGGGYTEGIRNRADTTFRMLDHDHDNVVTSGDPQTMTNPVFGKTVTLERNEFEPTLYGRIAKHAGTADLHRADFLAYFESGDSDGDGKLSNTELDALEK